MIKTHITAAHWGLIEATIENGKVVSSRSADPQIIENEMKNMVAEQIYTDARVRYPMVRKGFLEGNTDKSLRGCDKWVRISWEQALDLVHQQIQQVRETQGSEGIFAGSYGWKSCGALHSPQACLQRYLNLTGGFVGHYGDYSTAASQVVMPYVVGSNEAYQPSTSWETILEHTEILVLWGANPFTTARISWTSAEQKLFDYFLKFKAQGKPIICLDPMRSESCKMLEAEWIPVNTATDTALMLGIAYTLLSENLQDQDFLDNYTEGFEIFKDYLLGINDKQPKTAQWASQITAVPEETIKSLARQFASHRTMLMGGWSMQRSRFGEQAHWMLATLSAMLGQIGLAGGGFGLNYHNAHGGIPKVCGGNLGKFNRGKDNPYLEDFRIPVARLSDALLNPHKTIDFNGKKITYPDIKLIYWAGGNPFAHHQDTNLMIKAWQKPDCIIVNEIYWTATARMADIVLPVTTSFERNDLTMSSNGNIFPMPKLVEAQYEAKNDYDIFLALAERSGVAESFSENKTEMQWLAQFYQQAQQQAKKQQILTPHFADFWQANQPVYFPENAQNKYWVRYENFRKDPHKYPLNTPSGKIEIYSETLAKIGYEDCKGHPTWFEPEEFAGNSTKSAPLALVMPHLPYRLHSQLAYTSLREKYAINGREPLLIHKKDAEQRNIQQGDIVRVFNQRGQVLAGAMVTEEVIQGTVVLYEGAWYDPQDLGKTESPLCKNGNPNVLTRDQGTSSLAQGDSPNSCLVEVEKFEGITEEVTVFNAPLFTSQS